MRSFYSSKDFPVIRGVEWFNLFILALTPLLAVYGFACVSVQRKTMIWTTIYYLISMIGEPYHIVAMRLGNCSN